VPVGGGVLDVVDPLNRFHGEAPGG